VPGLVFFTLASPELRNELLAQCARLSIPCLDLLEGPVAAMRLFLGVSETHRPGGQHEVDHLDGVLFVDRMVDMSSLSTWAEFERHGKADFLARIEALVERVGS